MAQHSAHVAVYYDRLYRAGRTTTHQRNAYAALVFDYLRAAMDGAYAARWFQH